jgi:tetratricopeptide (TPR) repeat protein
LIGVVLVCAWVTVGCSPKGDAIYDVDAANDAGVRAADLASAAYYSVSNGAEPSEKEMQQLQEAEDIYQELIKFEPSVWGPWFELGRINLIQKDNKAAEENFNQFFLLSKDEKDIDVQKADGHFLIGTALLNMGRSDDAGRHADQALELKPDNPTYMLFKARTLVEQKKTEEAKELLVKMIQLYPDANEARALLKFLNKSG